MARGLRGAKRYNPSTMFSTSSAAALRIAINGW
jgi:hypothetical protein